MFSHKSIFKTVTTQVSLHDPASDSDVHVNRVNRQLDELSKEGYVVGPDSVDTCVAAANNPHRAVIFTTIFAWKA